MLSPRELAELERRLWDAVGQAGDSGGCSLVEIADVATRSLSAVLSAYRELHDEHAMLLQTARQATAQV